MPCAGHMGLGGRGRLAVPTGCEGRGSKRVSRSLLALSQALLTSPPPKAHQLSMHMDLGTSSIWLNVYEDMKHCLFVDFYRADLVHQGLSKHCLQESDTSHYCTLLL